VTHPSHHWLAGMMLRPPRYHDDLYAAHVLDMLDGLRPLNAMDVAWLEELRADAADNVHRAWAEHLLNAAAERAQDY
jgi:hypothetical protein